MRTILLALTVSAVQLFAADTLYVAREVPPSRRALMVLAADSLRVEPSGEHDLRVWGKPVVRDSLGLVLILPGRWALLGVDSSRVKLVWTTMDTLPGDWGQMQYRLNAEGFFERVE